MSAPHPAILDYPFAAPPAPGSTLAVAPGIRWLRMPLPFALDHINLWLLEEEEGFTLIDCGYGDAPTRALWETHFTTTLRGRPLVRIIATHYHPDHLGNAAWLSQRFDCPVMMTQTEFLTAHAVIDERATHGPLDIAAHFRAHGLSAEDVSALVARGNRYRHGVPSAPPSVQRLLPGDEVGAGTGAWRVIAGYGHSPEHASLFDAARNVLVSGDMLLPKISTNVSVGPSDPDGDSLGRFLDSLTAFEDLRPDALVLPSHGLPFRGIPLRVAQLRAHHDARLAELLEAIATARTPVSAAQMVPILFRRPLDLQQRFFAMGEAIAHLNYLWRRDRVRRTLADDGTLHFAA